MTTIDASVSSAPDGQKETILKMNRPANAPTAESAEIAADSVYFAVHRYSDQNTGWQTRLAGAGGTSGICVALILIGLFRWSGADTPVPAPLPLTVVQLEQLEAPKEEVREIPEGPQQVQQQKNMPKKSAQMDPLPDLKKLPSVTEALAQPPSEKAVATEMVPETTAPKSIPAPPARQASQNAPVTWQSKLMAHLEKYRRYPEAARARGAQGAAKVTFRMNRAGRLLSSRIVRSSGSSALDRAAIDTLKRAQPLPAIPQDMADEIELTIDIEFFTR